MFKQTFYREYLEDKMKILVGYDGSNVAKEALELAQKRALTFGANIEVVQTMEQSHKLGYEEISKAESNLEKEIRKFLNGDRPNYDTHLVITNLSTGEELVDYAQRNKLDEIIIGVKRRSKVGKLMFGSTAQHVILNASCPVVSIK
jgi:nucleotide-binding universal stress UspA family protein